MPSNPFTDNRNLARMGKILVFRQLRSPSDITMADASIAQTKQFLKYARDNYQPDDYPAFLALMVTYAVNELGMVDPTLTGISPLQPLVEEIHTVLFQLIHPSRSWKSAGKAPAICVDQPEIIPLSQSLLRNR